MDYVAKAVVYLGERHRHDGYVFHIASSALMPLERIFEFYNETTDAPMMITSQYEWLQDMKRLHEKGQSLPIFPLIEPLFLLDEAAFEESNLKRKAAVLQYDCRRTHAELEAARISVPKFDREMFNIYLSGMRRMDEEFGQARIERITA